MIGVIVKKKKLMKTPNTTFSIQSIYPSQGSNQFSSQSTLLQSHRSCAFFEIASPYHYVSPSRHLRFDVTSPDPIRPWPCLRHLHLWAYARFSCDYGPLMNFPAQELPSPGRMEAGWASLWSRMGEYRSSMPLRLCPSCDVWTISEMAEVTRSPLPRLLPRPVLPPHPLHRRPQHHSPGLVEQPKDPILVISPCKRRRDLDIRRSSSGRPCSIAVIDQSSVLYAFGRWYRMVHGDGLSPASLPPTWPPNVLSPRYSHLPGSPSHRDLWQ